MLTHTNYKHKHAITKVEQKAAEGLLNQNKHKIFALFKSENKFFT